MSKSKKSSHAPGGRPEAPGAAPATEQKADKMSPARRLTLILIAVFCLLIFSVTGPMADTLGAWFRGGPEIYATLELPSGKAEIDRQEYTAASRLKEMEERLFGRATIPGNDMEAVLAYATLMRLGEEFEVAVPDQVVADWLERRLSQLSIQYGELYRAFGFSTARGFERGLMEPLLRVRQTVQLLSAAAVPTEEDVERWWQENYEEMHVQFVHWTPEQFADAAAELEPGDEELAAFYEEELTPGQRTGLEREQAVAFEVVLVDEEALESEALASWWSMPQPEQGELDAFYDANCFTLYRRPEPEEGAERDPDAGALLTQEELGDRLLRDYALQDVILEASYEIAEQDDVAAWAAAKGLEHLVYEEPVPLSELPQMERIGSPQLRGLFSSEPGTWRLQPVLTDEGTAYLMRATQIRDRALPPLAEVRDEVVELWRGKRQQEMAGEAAEDFLEALPKGEGWVEGDPVTLSAEEFVQAASAAGAGTRDLGWLSRERRPTVDPVWPADAIEPRVRRAVASQLPDLLEGQTVGPEDFQADGVVVAHLIARREADPADMWPGERERARMMARSEAYRRFNSDQISFEGFAKSYALTRVLQEDAP